MIGDWVTQSACRAAVLAGEAEPDWWFADARGGRTCTVRARAICCDCPVQGPCLEWALRFGETGIWAGTTERERRGRRFGISISLVCEDCTNVFDSVIGCGPKRRLCDECRDVRDRDRKRSFDVENRIGEPGQSPGMSLENGHGRISRYNGGCRCKACRRVAREQRRRYRLGVSA